VWTWGEGSCRQLGRTFALISDAMRPETIELRDVVAVGAGYRHSFAVDKYGVVWGWGLNMSNQLGLDNATGKHISYPTQIPALHPSRHNGAKVVQFAAG